MKYILGFTGSFVILCLIITAAILPNMPDARAEEQARQQSEASFQAQSEITSQDSKENEYEYILSESNGVIAAYRKGKSEPIYVSTVRVSDLPEADRIQLRCGIKAQTRHQLNKLIEEYCS